MAWLEKKKKPKRWVLLAITNGLNQKILAHLLTDCFRYKKKKKKRKENKTVNKPNLLHTPHNLGNLFFGA